MKIDINPRHELFRWGPIDGKLIYPDFFNIAFIKFQKNFVSCPDVLWIMNSDRMICIFDSQSLIKNGRKNFIQFILNDQEFKNSFRRWQDVLKKWLKYQKTISAGKLSELSNRQLYLTYKRWLNNYLDFWTLGLLPEVASLGGEAILREGLQSTLPANDFIKVFERLSAPKSLSFYQKSDLDLLKLSRYKNNPTLFEKKLSQHQKKYFWILNSYHYTQVLSNKYFRQELLKFKSSDINKKIKELKNYSSKITNEKKLLEKKYKLSKEIIKMAQRLSFCISWQDSRKYYIFLANHYVDIFLHEFSRRYRIDFKALQYYGGWELLDLARDQKKLSEQEISRRFKNLVVHYSQKNNDLEYISGSAAKKIISLYSNTKINKKINELKGVVVSRGQTIYGRVRILTSSKEFYQMKKDEILVAPMTSPEYIVAIKKAAAIVTDEGGMTCHAAIVSRELGIPCVVGTKIATQVFKTGDWVEVDTKKGVVKIYEK
ncbi:MAG: PEP-utilizing enzyme [Candidatus Buchananbacteria bacterium]